MLTNCEDAVIALRTNAAELRAAIHGRPHNRNVRMLRDLATANELWAARLLRYSSGKRHRSV